MKNLIVTVLIALFAGCLTGCAGVDQRAGSPGFNPRLDKQPDNMFHSWIN